ncbi:MAG: hypothetical protein ACLTAN_06405, partial [Christensenellaceae bacterium]
ADLADILFGDYGIVAETVSFLWLNHSGFLLILFYFAFSATENKHGENFLCAFMSGRQNGSQRNSQKIIALTAACNVNFRQ